MSEYGIKIKNFEASTIYECNLGVRKIPKTTRAMFSNSLFNDFLVKNGLKVTKSGATRDIICLEFKFGSRSYQEEIEHIEKMLANNNLTEEKRKSIEKIREDVELNKDKYDKKTKEEIRDIYYKDGVTIEYVTYKKDGVTEKKREKIHYKMLYRTPGKAKKGSCMFICDRLFKKAQKYIRMGIKLPKNNSPIVEIGAYSSLITSSICGRVRINPKNILVVEDLDSFFETKVISVETDDNKQCIAKTVEKYKLKNTMFDGQALIDHSKFPEWGNGYILLRQHFCKMAAFDTYIQKFFMDYYGDDYLTATITDMFGVEHYVKDIELITTDNAMKWLKFNVTYDYWCDRVYEDGCMFGIVKTAHKSKLGDMQRMSYQMVNALDESIMDKVAANSKEYIESMKDDDEVFLDYLRKNQNFSNDFEVIVALCEQNPEFTRSEYFRSRKYAIIKAYTMNFKGGRLLQNGDNLVIVGSPYAMLLHAVGEPPENDITFETEKGTIQCYTGRFKDGERLAFFRSPFNSKNNMSFLHNHYHPYFEKYFNLGEQIIAVNMRNTDFQDRNNGSDQDSDSGYTTNQKEIADYAEYCYLNYPTIVNNIPKEKNTYTSDIENFSKIDNNLAAASRAIGESSNLAQIALTYSYNFKNQKYIDYVCILSVLAQVAIDNAKRRFDVDLNKEIDRIKKDIGLKDKGYPEFWGVVKKPKSEKNKRGFNKELIKYNLECPMNYLSHVELIKERSSSSTLSMSNFFVQHELKENRRKSKKVEDLISKFSLQILQDNIENTNDNIEEYLLERDDFDTLIQEISSLYVSSSYAGLMSWLIDRAFCITVGAKRNKSVTNSTLNNNKSTLMKVLYTLNPVIFLSCFTKNERK